MFKHIAIVILALGFAGIHTAQAMSIEEAYRAIPHGQTTYDYSQSTMGETEAIYLHELFAMTDEAVRMRVILLQNFFHDPSMTMDYYIPIYESILSKLAALEPPNKKTAAAQKLIIEAIDEQFRFFIEWGQASGNTRNKYKSQYTGHKLVQSSHQKLLKAYGLLMQAYPQETAHNKKAFFDHLCALDFI